MILLLLACDRQDRGSKDAPADTDTGTPRSCASSPVPSTALGRDREPEVRLHGEWSLQAGWGVRLGDVDADGCAELLIGEHRNEHANISRHEEPAERVVVLDPPTESGPVGERGWWFAESGYTEEDGATEDGEMEPYAWFGWDLAVDTRNRHLLIGARTSISYFQVGAFPFPADTTARPQDNVGLLVPSRQIDYPLFTTNLGVATTSAGDRLWTATYQTIGPTAFAGEVYTFDLPLTGEIHERAATAVYRADPGDFVQFGVTWTDDVDGDGVTDLLMGAHARNDGAGAVAVVSAPPEGDHRIWDLATATVDGVASLGRLGDQVATGDLDDDGVAELLTGAAMVYGSSTFHAFRGPLEGAHLATSSEWTIHGEDGLERLGVSSAAADLDGDGSTDLVVGRPGNPALGTQDGSVLLFHGPVAPGEYGGDDADVVVRNAQPPGTGDFFGYVLRTGDLNGDGAHELVISAPNDVEGHRPVGSVQILYGRPELFAF